MKCPMLEERHGERDDHDRAKKKTPLLRTFLDEDSKSAQQSGQGNRPGERLERGHIWSAERPSQSCAIALEYANRGSAAYLQMSNIDKVKRDKIGKRSRVTRRRPAG